MIKTPCLCVQLNIHKNTKNPPHNPLKINQNADNSRQYSSVLDQRRLTPTIPPHEVVTLYCHPEDIIECHSEEQSDEGFQRHPLYASEILPPYGRLNDK